MGKRDELIEKYHAEMDELGIKYDAELFKEVVIGCGPSIYDADASIVASSDPEELETVKKNFLIKKLGLSDADALDDGIAQAVETMGKSNKRKYRAIFNYLLVGYFGKEELFNK